MSDSLLVKFKDTDSPYSVTRKTVKSLAKHLDVSETMLVNIALASFAKEHLPSYEADNAALTDQDIHAIKQAAKPKLPKGKLLRKTSLFEM